MPIYATKCECCGAESDVLLPLARYNELPTCCGETVQRVITAPYIAPDIQPYKSMVTGEMITSRSQHRSHLKQHNMIEVGNEMPKPKKIPEVSGLKEELYARVSG